MRDDTLECAWQNEVHKLWKEIELLRQSSRPLPEINCNFGEALIHLKAGRSISRKCWRNKAIRVFLWQIKEQPELRVITIQGINSPWMPNHSELLADDWMVIA